MAPTPIEQLPPELIQPIFELSGFNPALPIASHHLAARLSADHVYHATCTHWLTQYHGSYATRSAAQTRIFAAKWMTWAYLKTWVIKHFGASGCLCGKTATTGCFDPIWPPHFEDATGMVFSRSHLPVLAYVKCRIPAKLLQGPWTTDKVQFLRFLLWTSSMTVDWADKATRDIAIAGRLQAILEQNLAAVELFNHNCRLGKAPRLDQVRFAVIEANCNRSIVYNTMDTARLRGLRGAAWECPVLDQWCEERPDEPKAKWLALKLRELRATEGHGVPAISVPSPAESAGIQKNVGKEPVIAVGRMDPKSGDYDDVDGDKLTIGEDRWNRELDQPGWCPWGLGLDLLPPRLGYSTRIIGLSATELFFLYVARSELYELMYYYDVGATYEDLGSEFDTSEDGSLFGGGSAEEIWT